jgi:transcriptional regulator with XRE-family HTH domain
LEFKFILKDLREQKGLSQAELANIVGVSQGVISQYERGDRKPTNEIHLKLSKALGVSMDFLMGDKDDVS